MTRLKVILLTAAAIGFTGTASAMPISNLSATTSDDFKQNVRLICNEWGNCYETRRKVRRVYRQGPYYPYDDAPRAYGYYGAPDGYYSAPSIGFSFGFGDRRWGSHRGWGW